MRVVYVTANFPYGEGEAYFESELTELGRQGYEILVVPRSTRGFALNVIPGHGWQALPGPLVSPRILLKACAVLVRRPRRVAAAVALLGDRSHLLRNLAVVPKAIWLGDLAERWGADHIHAHWASTTSTMAMMASKSSGIPWSFTAHRWDIDDGNLVASKVGSASFTRVISRAGLALLSQQAQERDRAKIHVVHMGVEVPEVSAPLVEKTHGADRPSMICVGHLNEGKGHSLLLDAVAGLIARGLSDLLLLIAGDGPLMETLREKVASLDIGENVRFLGHVAHDGLLSLYASGAIDLSVLPSSFEGIPVALMEAMSYGIPVIASSVGGVPELCGDDCGILIPPEDCGALAEAIEALLADRKRMAYLGERGRRRVIEEFAVEKTVARLASLMAAAASGGGSCAES